MSDLTYYKRPDGGYFATPSALPEEYAKEKSLLVISKQDADDIQGRMDKDDADRGDGRDEPEPLAVNDRKNP